ncbi:hypothetical protein [Tenuifilum thalassicum]|uniref:Uncharacterized protein n=1 Tax=Tenuifilum thalassicum TaxID=2590900 RepID=A0A7D3XLZ1_9BACT|nr:hypothetical protein [Tenuifilum thalassicum]QKG79796.1 hypothetical protein FHG85_05815 [Tenuifilum thalassicum]
MKLPLFFCIVLLPALTVKGQDNFVEPNLKFDFVSRHLWRGMRNNTSPAIQPTIELNIKKFYTGFWASYSLGTENVQEIDVFVGYRYKNIDIAIYDYYNPIDTIGWESDFWVFRNSKTRHTLDAIVTVSRTEKFPFDLLLSTMFYGYDRDEISNKNLYSTYFELQYQILNSNSGNLLVHLGGTPFKSYYAKRAAIVNTGITMKKDIKLSSNFSIPTKASLIFNPYSNQIFLLAAFTIG